MCVNLLLHLKNYSIIVFQPSLDIKKTRCLPNFILMCLVRKTHQIFSRRSLRLRHCMFLWSLLERWFTNSGWNNLLLQKEIYPLYYGSFLHLFLYDLLNFGCMPPALSCPLPYPAPCPILPPALSFPLWASYIMIFIVNNFSGNLC